MAATDMTVFEADDAVVTADRLVDEERGGESHTLVIRAGDRTVTLAFTTRAKRREFAIHAMGQAARKGAG